MPEGGEGGTVPTRTGMIRYHNSQLPVLVPEDRDIGRKNTQGWRGGGLHGAVDCRYRYDMYSTSTRAGRFLLSRGALMVVVGTGG